MDGLQGSLTTMPMADLLRYLTERGLSGTVRCQRGPAQKSFVIEEGSCTLASSNEPREYLGQFLLNYGHVTEEQLTQAFETQKETRVLLGRILSMIGLVEEPVIQQVLGLKIRESLLSVLEWSGGDFHFAHGEVPDANANVSVSIPLDEVLREMEFRRTAWESIRAVFPHGRLTLRVEPGAEPHAPHPLDARVLALAREGQTLDEMALTLHATPFALHQRLFALHAKGVVRPVEPDEPDLDEAELPEVDVVTDDEDEPIVGRAAPVSEVVERALVFLREGKYAEARAVAGRAVEMAPDEATAQRVLAEAETGLLAALRAQLLARPLVPRVIAGADEIERLRLTPPQRYLLKRFDGKRQLGQVLRVSPIREVEVLQLVRRFLDAGLIRLAEP